MGKEFLIRKAKERKKKQKGSFNKRDSRLKAKGKS